MFQRAFHQRRALLVAGAAVTPVILHKSAACEQDYTKKIVAIGAGLALVAGGVAAYTHHASHRNGQEKVYSRKDITADLPNLVKGDLRYEFRDTLPVNFGKDTKEVRIKVYSAVGTFTSSELVVAAPYSTLGGLVEQADKSLKNQVDWKVVTEPGACWKGFAANTKLGTAGHVTSAFLRGPHTEDAVAKMLSEKPIEETFEAKWYAEAYDEDDNLVLACFILHDTFAERYKGQPLHVSTVYSKNSVFTAMVNGPLTSKVNETVARMT